jgi:nucleotide-binding universal stress UspA family protein
VNPAGARLPERIVVGIDGSLCSHAAVRWALDHARRGDTVTLVHAWQASPSVVGADLVDPTDDHAARTFAHRELARARALPNADTIELSYKVINGDAGDCLSNQTSDLVVVGARGHAGLAGILLGSVSTHLARHCPVPLVIVPCPEHTASPPAAP